MLGRFVRVTDEIGDEYVINVDCISWIHQGTRHVCMSGTNASGCGLLRLGDGEAERLIEALGVDDDSY